MTTKIKNIEIIIIIIINAKKNKTFILFGIMNRRKEKRYNKEMKCVVDSNGKLKRGFSLS